MEGEITVTDSEREFECVAEENDFREGDLSSTFGAVMVEDFADPLQIKDSFVD